MGSRLPIDPTSSYEAHKKLAQATAARDSETIATAPESQASRNLFLLYEQFIWFAVEGCGSCFGIRLQLVMAGDR
jgi:hypothetical protein